MNWFTNIMGRKQNIAEVSMREAMERAGGKLTFTITRSPEGWFAECEEIDAIITGGSNPMPTDQEITASIQEAVMSVFNPADGSNTVPPLALSSMQFALPTAVMA